MLLFIYLKKSRDVRICTEKYVFLLLIFEMYKAYIGLASICFDILFTLVTVDYCAPRWIYSTSFAPKGAPNTSLYSSFIEYVYYNWPDAIYYHTKY